MNGSSWVGLYPSVSKGSKWVENRPNSISNAYNHQNRFYSKLLIIVLVNIINTLITTSNNFFFLRKDKFDPTRLFGHL